MISKKDKAASNLVLDWARANRVDSKLHRFKRGGYCIIIGPDPGVTFQYSPGSIDDAPHKASFAPGSMLIPVAAVDFMLGLIKSGSISVINRKLWPLP